MKVEGYYVVRFQEKEGEPLDSHPFVTGPYRTRAVARDRLNCMHSSSQCLQPWVGVIVKASEARVYDLFQDDPTWKRRMNDVIAMNVRKPRKGRRR